MPVKPFHSKPDRRRVTLAVLVAATLMVMACGGIGNVSSAIGAAATAAAAMNTSTTSQLGATSAPGAGGAVSSAQCQTIGDAFVDFEFEYPFLNLASDNAYGANTPDNPAYVNIPKIRADLASLALLPGGTVGTLGGALAQFNKLVDLVDSNFKAGGKPFSNGSNDGQKVIDLYLTLAAPYIVVAEGFGNACPNYTAAPAGTPAPAVAGFAVGQTAPVGDLRVTLVSVAEAPLEADHLPTPGNRFLLLNVTIENTGQAALQITSLTETDLKDAAGTSYGKDPFANALNASTSDASLDGEIPAGGKHSGLLAYQLPRSAGDLVWSFQDYGASQAVFAVKASDIDTSGASSAPTEDALRGSAAATMTEFYGLIATSDAMDLTATAVAP